MRALELFCGIGGFTAASRDLGIDVVAAIDASQHVIATYNHNFDPVGKQRNILQMKVPQFADYDADLWWMSPPCAPYTRRGNRLDLDDHRTAGYLRVVAAISQHRPPVVAMENVEGFATSEARTRMIDALDGYAITEWVLCPTMLGVPNKRPRYYLVAHQADAATHRAGDTPQVPLEDWRDFVDHDVSPHYRVPDEIIERYGRGFHIMDPDESYTTCFTGSYGKSWNYTGSYLRLADGGLRRFTPREVLRFLGFADEFSFPEELDERQQYKYAGNSLSLPAVRHVLQAL